MLAPRSVYVCVCVLLLLSFLLKTHTTFLMIFRIVIIVVASRRAMRGAQRGAALFAFRRISISAKATTERGKKTTTAKALLI